MGITQGQALFGSEGRAPAAVVGGVPFLSVSSGMAAGVGGGALGRNLSIADRTDCRGSSAGRCGIDGPVMTSKSLRDMD
jgi:hypothetical protein